MDRPYLQISQMGVITGLDGEGGGWEIDLPRPAAALVEFSHGFAIFVPYDKHLETINSIEDRAFVTMFSWSGDVIWKMPDAEDDSPRSPMNNIVGIGRDGDSLVIGTWGPLVLYVDPISGEVLRTENTK